MRFSGFDDEWQSCRFDELFDFQVAGDMKKELFNEEFIDEYKYPLYANALENEGLLGYYKEYKYNPNSITVTARGNIGHATARKNKFNAVGRLIILTPKEDLNIEFFTEYINNNVKIYIESTGVPQLTAPSLKINKLHYPTLNEQNKISNLLIMLNNKIELLGQKHQLYQYFKKYLMQQIFTQKLRFNFTDDWNYMNFSEIFKSVSTKKYQIKSADILDKGDFEVIDQGQDEIAGYFNDKTKLCQELPIIIYGDHTTFVKFRDKPFIVGADGVKLLIPKFNANPKYLFYALEHFNIKPEGYKRHFSIIKKIKLPIPTLEEQNEISEIFNYIDIKLKYTKIQLQETEEFKKGLLQQMFIVRINCRCNFKLAKSPSFNKHLLILKNKIIFIIIE